MTRWTLFAAGMLAVGIADGAHAQSAEDFYRKRHDLTMIVGSSAGGGYDGYARMIARYMSKYLPGNPTFIVNNMPGAGGVRAANFLYNVAPKDGSTIAIWDRGLPTAPLLYGDESKTQYDAQKMNWLGSAQRESGMGIVSTALGIRSLADAKNAEIVVGATGQESDPAMFARLTNELFGTRFKVIPAYKGLPEIVQAIERGELGGMFLSGWGGPVTDYLLSLNRDNKVSFIVQLSKAKAPNAGDAPLIVDLVSSPQDQQVLEVILSRLEVGRPFVAPPGVPADRVKLLRAAFVQACNDPTLVLEGSQAQRNVSPMAGEDVQSLIDRIYATPAPILERIRAVVKMGN